MPQSEPVLAMGLPQLPLRRGAVCMPLLPAATADGAAGVTGASVTPVVPSASVDSMATNCVPIGATVMPVASFNTTSWDGATPARANRLLAALARARPVADAVMSTTPTGSPRAADAADTPPAGRMVPTARPTATMAARTRSDPRGRPRAGA